jgi:hypothetical protein
MWSVARDDVAMIVRKDIQTTRFMFTIMCTPGGSILSINSLMAAK